MAMRLPLLAAALAALLAPAGVDAAGCVAGAFSLEFDGACTAAAVVAAYAEQVFASPGAVGDGCDLDAAEDLQAKLAAAGLADAYALCDAAYATQDQVPFTDTAKRGDDLSGFIAEFYAGRTDWQEEVETLYESPDGTATSRLKDDAEQVRAFYDGVAQGWRVAWPGSLPNFQSSVTNEHGEPTCETGAAMCVWPKDRQANDNNGNCATPYDENCVDKDVADNTNLCYVDPDRGNASAQDGEGLLLFPGDNNDGEGAIHCHGFAWSNDANDHTARYRANNLFFVSMYDHMYQRGYVKNIPGAPMCGCVEQMPTVSRCDCTQVDLTETIKITYDPDADAPFQSMLTQVYVDFNSCQGINNRNNDLWAYIARLYHQGDLTRYQFGQAGRIITDTNCDEATEFALHEKGLTTGYDHDVTLWTNVAGRDALHLRDHYGRGAFVQALNPGDGHYGIIYRVCAPCIETHQKIFYRRRTPVPEGFDLLDNILYRNHDGSGNNKWTEDFSLHSTLEDALADVHPWLCPGNNFDYNYNFYGRCSPDGTRVDNQQSRFDWGHQKKDVAYYTNQAEAEGFEDLPTTAIKGRAWARGMALRDPDDGAIYMTGAGQDIWWVTDDFNFLSEPYTGDVTVIVHAGSMSSPYPNEWSKSGIMLRASMEPDAPHYSVVLTGTRGICYYARLAKGAHTQGACVDLGATSAWLKIEKRTDTFTAFTASSAPYTGSYVGCFQDDGNRDFKHGPRQYGYGTTSCNNACAGYRYFALQDGGWCQCDDSYGDPTDTYPKIEDSRCEAGGHNRPGFCGGACGGPWANAVYEVVALSEDPVLEEPTEWTMINSLEVPAIAEADGYHAGLAVCSKRYYTMELVFQQYQAESYYFPSAAPSESSYPTMEVPRSVINDGSFATQSTTCHGGEAARAIDGDTTRLNWWEGSVTHTCWEYDPWWQVDLGREETLITNVVVYNRKDGGQDRLRNTDLEIFDADGTVVATQPFEEVTKEEYHFRFGRPIAGRTVRVQRKGWGELNIAEVVVFGTYVAPSAAPSVSSYPTMEVPLSVINDDAEATQSTECHGGKPARAIDGDTTRLNWWEGSVMHTCGEYDPWWKVDLGRDKTQITNVVVYNRKDCCQDRLLNTDLEILDADGTVVATQPFEGVKDVYHFGFGRVVGRTVRVQRKGWGELNIAEVEVFGTYVAPSAAPSLSLAPTIEGPRYLGCFRDDGSRDFKDSEGSGKDVTSCSTACTGFKYFALQYGGHCYCGDEYSTPASQYPQIDDEECLRGVGGPGYCGGPCGGPWANAVYGHG